MASVSSLSGYYTLAISTICTQFIGPLVISLHFSHAYISSIFPLPQTNSLKCHWIGIYYRQGFRLQTCSPCIFNFYAGAFYLRGDGRSIRDETFLTNDITYFEIALSQTLIRFKITLKGKHADSLGAVKSDICLDQSLLKYLACFISARRLFSVLSGANLPANVHARVCSAKN